MRGGVLLGLLQGLLLWLLHQSIVEGAWPGSGPGWWPTFYLIVVLVPTTLLLLWEHRGRRSLWLALCVLVAFVTLSSHALLGALPVPGEGGGPDEVAVAGYLLPLGFAWWLALSLGRAWLEAGRWPPSYPTLFRATWRGSLLLAESGAFTLLFWGLLGLWSALFLTLDIELFRDVFTSPLFVYPVTCAAFATATRIVGRSDRLVDGLLDQALGLLKWLAPMVLVILALFVAALIPRLPALLVSGERVMDSQWLILLVVAMVVSMNAAVRDGEADSGLGGRLERALKLTPLLAVIVAATAVYSLTVRSFAFGLTPGRFWGLGLAGFALACAAGYSHASLRPGRWMESLGRVNTALAVAALAFLLATLTPLADPLRWSIGSQRARALAAGTYEERRGPLTFLRFDAGEGGRRVLADLAGGAIASASAALRQEAAAMASLEERSSTMPLGPDVIEAEIARWESGLRVLPEGPVPARFADSLRGRLARLAGEGGVGAAPRPLLLVLADIDGDGTEDGLLIVGPVSGAAVHTSRYYPLAPQVD